MATDPIIEATAPKNKGGRPRTRPPKPTTPDGKPLPHGGGRPGAGRKPIELTKLRREWDRQVAEGLAPEIDRVKRQLMKLIEGVSVVGNDGEVYHQPPNIQAIREFYDRVVGKARQSIEHSGADGGPIETVALNAFERAYPDPDDLPSDGSQPAISGRPDEWSLDDPE